MTGSMDDFVHDQASKKAVDLERLSRYSVDNDRWDRKDFDKLLAQFPEVSVARKKLADTIAGELGYDEAADAIWMLYKISPELLADFDVRPSRLLNKRVNEELEKIDPYLNLRRWTTGEPVGAALAFEKMVPDIAILYDRMHKELEKQREYEEALQRAIEAMQEEMTAQQMLDQWLEENPEPEESEDEGDDEGDQPGDEPGEEEQPGEGGTPVPGAAGVPQQLIDALQQAQQRAQAAQAQAEQKAAELQAALDAAAPEMQQELQEAAQKANEYLDELNSMSNSWGQELKDLMRLPAKKRLELAAKLDTEKFRQMAKLIGPFTREALAENKRKITRVPEEIVDLTFGNDLARVIPIELARLDDEDLELLFLKDFAQGSLVQYEMRGTEKLARGGIIYCHDGSGSMEGQREVWAKAIGLALLHVARKQKRSFWGIQFGSTGQIRVDDFRDTRKLTPEQVIDFAEYFFNGGTCFMTPLRKALEIMDMEHREFGAVQSDIVFATDGNAGITDPFMKEFKEAQARLDFQVWGVAIQAGSAARNDGSFLQTEPLKTLCDGKVATVHSLLKAKDLKDVFRAI